MIGASKIPLDFYAKILYDKSMNKHPLEPFYGPEDYIGWGTVEEEMESHQKLIDAWHNEYSSMTWWQKVRLFFT